MRKWGEPAPPLPPVVSWMTIKGNEKILSQFYFVYSEIYALPLPLGRILKKIPDNRVVVEKLEWNEVFINNVVCLFNSAFFINILRLFSFYQFILFYFFNSRSPFLNNVFFRKSIFYFILTYSIPYITPYIWNIRMEIRRGLINVSGTYFILFYDTFVGGAFQNGVL